MTDAEKRRLRLLQETRKSYSDKYTPPAIHPRYGSAYQSLYGMEDSEGNEKRNTFLIRLFISMLILGLFFLMDYQQERIGAVDSKAIVNEIQKSFSQSLP